MERINAAKTRKVRMGTDERIFNIVGYIIVTLIAFICLFPFWIVVVGSFTSEASVIQNGYWLWPREFSLDSYRQSLASPIAVLKAYGVTILVTTVGTTISVIITTMTGWVLQRKDFPWRNGFSMYFFFTTLFSGGLVPWYILCVSYLGFTNNLLGLILPGMISVWNILLVKGFMGGIPFELVESGKIDGANDMTIFFRLILPISKPVVATILLFTALAYWNDWYNCMLFIRDKDMYNLQYFLHHLINSAKAMREIMTQSALVMDSLPVETMKMSMTIIVTGPIILLYPFIQKYFVSGLTIGAVKG